jgi:NAD(P)-dependent dehydrogenase (short-subunit alcohol dehydrogenase family)
VSAWHDLTGHVAVVTGGNGGIGLGMARGLRNAGAAVVIWGTNAAKNETAAAELTGLGDAQVGSFVVDVSDEDAVAAGLEATLEQFGRIDSCFANAGVGPHPTSIDTLTAQEWRRVMSVNLDGAFFTVRAVAAQMKSQGSGGSIVFTSSVSVSDGMAFSTQYAAAKSALVAMARALAVELARDDIRVNALVPGWTKAAMTEALLDSPTAQAKILPRIPLRRWGTPEDFEAVAVWLAGPGSAYFTGQTLVIDGGYTVF